MAYIEKNKKWTYPMTLTVAVLAATLLGGLYGERLFGAPVDNDIQKRLHEYTDLIGAVSYWSADDVGSDKVVYSSIEGMLRTLDPHTSFFEPREYADMQDRQKGSFYGLGILVTKRNDEVTVITPMEGTPAARLGIRAGDIIADVEGTSTNDLSLDEVVKRLKGPKGSIVHIKIKRIGIKEAIPLTITREAIPTNSISNVLMVKPGIGYIRIKDFTYTTVRELDDAIAKLETQGMQKLILDLRGNPGGLLDAAVGVTDHFIDKGQMIVYTKGRTPDSMQEYTAPGKAQTLHIPLVIIMNHGTASASEIVSGAIQDHDRGLLIGETSWGKGLVQSVYTLPYGAGLALTTSKYYTPSGRNIQRDYSSFYDYYVADESDDSTPDAGAQKDQKTFTTDTGRKVFGGGGITPDVLVKPADISRVVQLLEVRGTIFSFSVDYVAKHADAAVPAAIDAPMLEGFVSYAVSQGVAPEVDIRQAMTNAVDRAYVQRSILAEITAAKMGYDASYPVRLRGDEQVARAIALFPQAEQLAKQASEKRTERLASDERRGLPADAAKANRPN